MDGLRTLARATGVELLKIYSKPVTWMTLALLFASPIGFVLISLKSKCQPKARRSFCHAPIQAC